MANITYKNRYAQKRDISVGVYPVVEADILATGGAVVANLPKNILLLRSYMIVETVSTTATSTVAIDVGSTAVTASIAVTAATIVSPAVTARHFPSGGALTIKAGGVPPAAGDFVGTFVVEYIELEKATGEYTVVDNNG